MGGSRSVLKDSEKLGDGINWRGGVRRGRGGGEGMEDGAVEMRVLW